MHKAIIENNIVTNVLELPDDWTGVDGEWQAPFGATVIDAADAGIGDKWDGQSFISFATGIEFRALAEIARLETLETPRRQAEALLGTPVTNDPIYPDATNGTEWLEANRALIAIERAKL